MATLRLRTAGEILNQTLDQTEAVAAAYPFKLSRFLAERLADGSYGLAAARQFLPDVRELESTLTGTYDPCNERSYKVGSSVIQRYPNRAAIVVTHHCLVYCRFCFRRDFVGYPTNAVSEQALDEAIAYLASNQINRDVLITGGDPLALPNKKLIPLLERLAAIDHLKVIRIHSRALSTYPDRFDDELLEFFSCSHKFWLYAHMNHPDDVDHSRVRECAHRLQKAGVPILNQAVVLGGVNDTPQVLHDLMMRCYEERIVPYHLYALDQVPGTKHFAVSPDRLIELFESLEDLPGPAQPVFVVVDQHNLKHRMVPGRAIDRAALRRLLDGKAGPQQPLAS